MTTSAAGNVAGRAGDKEKVEKRRALGRGLASLLPGPRVVAEQPSAVSHIILRRARQFTRVERPGRNDLTRQMRRRSLDCCSRPSQRNAKVKIFLAQADNDLSLTFLDPLLGIFLVGL